MLMISASELQAFASRKSVPPEAVPISQTYLGGCLSKICSRPRISVRF